MSIKYVADGHRNSPIFSQPTPRRRVVNTIILLFLVATVIPYQFAYMVGCIVQLATCVRALWHAKEQVRSLSNLDERNEFLTVPQRMAINSSFFNYAQSILTLMLWVLPINILVLIVWVHNLAVHWLTPFSSHHNVLSIMPFMILVETMTTGLMIPRIFSRYVFVRIDAPFAANLVTSVKHVTYTLLFCLAGFAAVYGVSYAYLLHHVANLFAAWLVGIYLVSGGISVRRLFRILEGDEAVALDDTGHHVKKQP